MKILSKIWAWIFGKPVTLKEFMDSCHFDTPPPPPLKRLAYLGEPKKVNFKHFIDYLELRVGSNEKIPKEIHLNPLFVNEFMQATNIDSIEDYTLCGAKVVPNECIYYGGLIIVYDGQRGNWDRPALEI